VNGLTLDDVTSGLAEAVALHVPPEGGTIQSAADRPPSTSPYHRAHNAAGTSGSSWTRFGTDLVDGTWEIVVATTARPMTPQPSPSASQVTRVRLVRAFDRAGAGYARNVGVSATDAHSSPSATPTTW